MAKDFSDRQNEILNVSLNLIAENGIQGFTIKNLAKKIGFTESAVYRHFETKFDILSAILDMFKNTSQKNIDKELKSNISAISKIENIFFIHFKIFNQTPSLVAVIFSEELFKNEAILSNKVKDIVNNFAKVLTTIIEYGKENGEIRKDIQTDLLVTMLMGSVRMLAKQWYMSDFSFDLLEKGKRLIDSLKIMIAVI